MNKYENGKIYTIRCRNDDTLIYVGSTIQPLHQRWSGHKRDSLKKPNILLYQTVNNNWDEWYIELYEECKCDNREQLGKREGEIIREIGTLNKQITGRTRKETLHEYNKKNAEKMKDYQVENRDRLREYRRDWF